MGTIAVHGLGKAYKQYPTRWSRLAEWVVPFLGQRHELKWVLRDIDFTVSPGRALGIIGVNGAGKSTLLKMITGTTLPTTGRVQVSGRVAALLELGIGFHPDFTGRQNAVTAAQLLGLSPHDIEQAMPGIEAFAEIGDYIDQPVRVYSSGMQMRLAFSVATALRPDVLIVDEALSVGDAYFQHKSFDRIRAFREQGTTLLIVSHDKAVIQSICDEAIVLHEGRLAVKGDPESVVDYYNALIAKKENSTVQRRPSGEGRIQTISGTGEVGVVNVRLLDASGDDAGTIGVGARVTVEVELEVHDPVDSLVVGFTIKDRLGQPVFGTNTYHLDRMASELSPGERVTVRFGFAANIGQGSYSISVAAHESETHLSRNYEWRDLALVFKVVYASVPPFVGTSWLPTTAEVERVSTQENPAHHE